MDKRLARLHRARKTRAKIKTLFKPRLSVHRTLCNIYAQIIMPDGKVAASASTLDAEIKKEVQYGGNIAAAGIVGKYIAKRAQQAGVTNIAFDRSGFKYHGRVQALAQAARSHGLEL